METTVPAPPAGPTPDFERAAPPRHRPAASLLGLVAAVAIAVTVLAAQAGPADPRMLLVDADGTVALVDSSTGETGYTVPGAIPTPDGSTLLTTRARSGGTELASRDASDGRVTGRTALPDPDLTVRVVSPRGGAIALLPGQPGEGIYDPRPRAMTELTVAYTDDRPSRSFSLEGNLEPEMFSLDEDALFVLSFVPPTAPDGYIVQRLDLATGELTETGSPQADLNPKMSGRARAQVLHPEGTRLYTLYTQTEEPVIDPTGDEPRWAFIHVIDLAEQWSFCIFLDRPVGTGDQEAIGFGITPDGATLYVADSSTSTLTRVDAAELTAEAPRDLPQLRPGQTATAVAADDGGLHLASGSTVLQVDPVSLEVQDAWSFDRPVTGLAVTEGQLRVATDGRVVLLDRATGEETGVIRAPTGGQLRLLGPPAGQATRFPVECAC